MRKLLFILLFSAANGFCFCQTAANVDKEKLFDFYQNQQYSEAASYLTNIYGTDLKDFKVITQIAYCYLMGGNTIEAEKLYLKANLLQPQNLQVLFNLANISTRRGYIEKSKTYLKEVVKLDSTNFNAYIQLAGLYQEVFSFQKLQYLKSANKINPLDADVVFDMSEIYMKMGMYGLVSNILKPALETDSNNIQLLKIKLPLLLVTSKLDDAILTGEKLFTLGDSSTYVLNNLGKVYYTKKEFQKAIYYFKKVSLSATDDNEALFYNMALCYRGLKDYLTAAEYFKKAINAGISKNTIVYYTKMGESYEQAEKFESAAATYKKGVFFDNDGSLLYILAQIYDKKLNQKSNALTTYAQVLKSLPDTEGNKPAKEYITKRIEELRK
ncbi:tetratricopeptide repeat protein [Pedobacter mucosus]|uniref:tetratricopeptide repeat protein n=1 Tax=Pedobacter mucosus TaxID=2895286 RepID=UPI001EE3E2CB|nr:tetratricopeptide repeat protein [Pedobacter mucosus]UKT64468.1 tetratricopeptide repeat protein [Pedobacter mucosus]